MSRAAEIWRTLLCLGSPTHDDSLVRFATHVGMLCFSVLGWRGGIEEQKGAGGWGLSREQQQLIISNSV